MMQRPKYIFCINPGRSGSQYLAKLLGTAQNVVAFHEATPPMIGPFLKVVTYAQYSESYRERRIKVAAIKNIMKDYPSDYTYVETNHMFIKTFFDVACNELENIRVIHLRRKFCDVLKSFIELQYFTSFNSAWPDWMISPNAVTRAIEPIAEDHVMDSVHRTIAYLIDIEMRALRFQKQYPHVPVHIIDLESLNNPKSVDLFFYDLGLEYGEGTKKLIGQRINERIESKKKYAINVQSDVLNNEIIWYLKRMEFQGIAFDQNMRDYILETFETV
jgi:hypothetical protein